MAQFNTQEPISLNDLKAYLDFLVTQQVKDEKDFKRVNRTAKRTVTVSDVVILAKAITTQQDFAITQLIDKLQVQDRVLRKLGATDELIAEAEAEYDTVLKEREKAIKEAAELSAKANNDTLTEESFNEAVKLVKGE